MHASVWECYTQFNFSYRSIYIYNELCTIFKKYVKEIFCHGCRVHRFSEQVEYRFVDRLTIVGVPFGGLK